MIAISTTIRGNVNVVADEFSRKSSSCTLDTMYTPHMLLDMEQDGIEMVMEAQTLLRSLVLGSIVLDQIKSSRVGDLGLKKIVDEVREGNKPKFKMIENCTL